jgi:branched-chain amino acid aminotransferase
VLTSLGYKVEERLISIDELIGALKEGKLEEAWGTGTAAVVSPIGRLMYDGVEYIVNGEKIGEVTQQLYDILTGIQWGRVEDKFGWIYKI